MFWLYVALFLAVPPLLYGLALAVAYLWVRWKRLVLRVFNESGERSVS